MPTDPNILMERARCYTCIPRGLERAVMVAIIGQWASVSSTAVTTDPDADAYIAAAGLTDATQKAAIQKFVTDLKGNGTPNYWSREVIIYPFLGGGGATPYASTRVNLRSPGNYDWIQTAGHEPDYSAVGVQGNIARTAYLRTGYILAPIQQNFFRVFHYLDQDSTVDTTYHWGASQVFNELISQHNNAGGQLTYWLNDGTPTTPFGAGALLGGTCLQRAAAATKQAGYAGGNFVNTAVASVGEPPVEIYLLSSDANGAVFGSGDARLSGWSVGQPFSSDADWSGYYAIWQTFQTTLGRNH